MKMFWIPAITDRISFKTVLWIVRTSFTIWAITGGLMMTGWLGWFGRCTWRQRRPSSRASMEIRQRFVTYGVLYRLRAGGFPSRSSGCVWMRVAPAKLETNILRAVLLKKIKFQYRFMIYNLQLNTKYFVYFAVIYIRVIVGKSYINYDIKI